MSRKVLLCKSPSAASDEAYIEVFRESGYDCQVVPCLRFSYTLSDLCEHLRRPQNYSGLVLTSSRAVEAIERSQVPLDPWIDKAAYCVGPSTESSARRLGFRDCRYSNSGNAEELAKRICTDSPESLLYPCSELARETLPRILSESKIASTKVICYQTLPDKTSFGYLQTLEEAFVVLFSPSVVRNIENYLKAGTRWKLIAIGAVTESALRSIGCEVYATSEKPEPKSLLLAVESKALV